MYSIYRFTRVIILVLILFFISTSVAQTEDELILLNGKDIIDGQNFFIFYKGALDKDLFNLCLKVPLLIDASMEEQEDRGFNYYNRSPLFLVDNSSPPNVYVAYTDSPQGNIYKLPCDSTNRAQLDSIIDIIKSNRQEISLTDSQFNHRDSLAFRDFLDQFKRSFRYNCTDEISDAKLLFSSFGDQPSETKFQFKVNKSVKDSKDTEENVSKGDSIWFSIPPTLEYSYSNYGLVLNGASYHKLMDYFKLSGNSKLFFPLSINRDNDFPSSNFIPDYILSRLPFSFVIDDTDSLKNLIEVFKDNQINLDNQYNKFLGTKKLSETQQILDFYGNYTLQKQNNVTISDAKILPSKISLISVPSSGYYTDLKNAIIDFNSRYNVELENFRNISNSEIWTKYQRPFLTDKKQIGAKYFKNEDKDIDSIASFIKEKSCDRYMLSFDNKFLSDIEKSDSITYYYIHKFTEEPLEKVREDTVFHIITFTKTVHDSDTVGRDFTWFENIFFVTASLASLIYTTNSN